MQYLPLSGGVLTGNLGVGVAPAAWWNQRNAIQIGQRGALAASPAAAGLMLSDNTYVDSSPGDKAIVADVASRLNLAGGGLSFSTAPSVAAGAAQTFTPRLTVAENGSTYFGILAGDQPHVRISSAQQSSPSGAMVSLELQNTSSVGIDYHNINVAKWGMLYANGATVNLGHDLGWGKPATIVVNAGDFAVKPGSAGAQVHLHSGNATNSRLATAVGNLELNAAAQYIHPSTDNYNHLGAGGQRWIAVYAVSGTINTCSRADKEIVGTVNDTVALQQLMSLPAIYRFHYKHYVPVEGAPPDASAVGAFTLEVDTSREFLGPIAEEMPADMKVGDTVGGNVNTEGHLMASLRGAVKEYRDRIADLANRMTILEGRLPA